MSPSLPDVPAMTEPLHHESPAAFEKFLREQQAFWIGIVKRANITAE